MARWVQAVLNTSRTNTNSTIVSKSIKTRESVELRSLRSVVENDEDALALYAKWNESKEPPISYAPGNVSAEPWASKAAQAFVLAVQIRQPLFERYALSQFVQNCALMVFGPWSYIEKSTGQHSAIRLFSNHWVAWNLKISDGHAKEFEGLVAAGLVSQVPKSGRDPRIYDLDHWYDLCGRGFLPGCDHDPITRDEKLREENKPPKVELPEVGRDEEEECQQGETAQLLPRPPSAIPYPPPPPVIPPPAQPRISSPVLPAPGSPDPYIASPGRGPRFRSIATFFYLTFLIIGLGISVFLLLHYYYACHVRVTTMQYTLFTIASGFLCALLPRVSHRKTYFGLYMLLSICDGIALVIDMKRSETAALDCQPNHTPTTLAALTAFTWISIPTSALYLWSWRPAFASIS